MTGSETEPPRDADLPPGFHEYDPYEGEDLDKYPDWWRENIELFREHHMRPYRPPQFVDGELMPEVVEELEADLDVEIRFRVIDPHKEGHDWELWIDGEPVTGIGHTREGEGYTEYDLTASEFRSLVHRSVDG